MFCKYFTSTQLGTFMQENAAKSSPSTLIISLIIDKGGFVYNIGITIQGTYLGRNTFSVSFC